MARIDRGESLPMGTEGTEVKARRERLGMTIQQLATEADVSRDTLSDLESGTKDFRRLTLTKIQQALTNIEQEAGITAPPPPPAEDALVEFEVSSGNRDDDVRVVVKGPIRDMPALEATVQRLAREMREAKGKTDES